jgi:hypothetical protein
VPAAKISEVLKAMHNWQPLLKNNRSAYLTLLKWVKRDQKEKPAEESKPSIPGTLRRLNPAS